MSAGLHALQIFINASCNITVGSTKPNLYFKGHKKKCHLMSHTNRISHMLYPRRLATSVHCNITKPEAQCYRGPKPAQPRVPLYYLPLLLPLFWAAIPVGRLSTSVRLKSLSILSKRPHLHFFCFFCLFIWPCLEVGTIPEPPGSWLPNLAIVSWLFILHIVMHGFPRCQIPVHQRFVPETHFLKRFAISPVDEDGMNFIPSLPTQKRRKNVSRLGLAVRHSAGKQKEVGSTPASAHLGTLDWAGLDP